MTVQEARANPYVYTYWSLLEQDLPELASTFRAQILAVRPSYLILDLTPLESQEEH